MAATVPQHVAIIMDGNGRWAKKRLLPRLAGHRAGAKSVRTVIEECCKRGIRYLTLYTFSTENWNRPSDEVQGLMQMFVEHLHGEVDGLIKHGVRLRAIGDFSRLSPEVQASLDHACERTKAGSTLQVILALSYGGRTELVHAVRSIAQQVQAGTLAVADINERVVQQNIYAPDVPDPDVVIRTSGECRISNFLLWQVAYSEIVLSSVFWPDFDAQEFERCLQDFASRERRLGKTSEQLPVR